MMARSHQTRSKFVTWRDYIQSQCDGRWKRRRGHGVNAANGVEFESFNAHEALEEARDQSGTNEPAGAGLDGRGVLHGLLVVLQQQLVQTLLPLAHAVFQRAYRQLQQLCAPLEQAAGVARGLGRLHLVARQHPHLDARTLQRFHGLCCLLLEPGEGQRKRRRKREKEKDRERERELAQVSESVRGRGQCIYRLYLRFSNLYLILLFTCIWECKCSFPCQ